MPNHPTPFTCMGIAIICAPWLLVAAQYVRVWL